MWKATSKIIKKLGTRKLLKKEKRGEPIEDIIPVIVAGITAYESSEKEAEEAVKRNIYDIKGDKFSLWKMGGRVEQINWGKRAGR